MATAKIYADGNLIAFQPVGESGENVIWWQPQKVHMQRNGDVFLIIDGYTNQPYSFNYANIQNEAGTAMASADAAETYLKALVPSLGGGGASGPFAGYTICAGVPRWSTVHSEWRFLNDGNHAPVGFDSITTNLVADQIECVFTTPFTEILTSSVTPDETFKGYNVGASIKVNQAEIQFVLPGPKLEKAHCYYNGSAWILNSSFDNTMTLGTPSTLTVESQTVHQIPFSHSDCGLTHGWVAATPPSDQIPDYVPFISGTSTGQAMSSTNTYVRVIKHDRTSYTPVDGDAFAVFRYSQDTAANDKISPDATPLQNQTGNLWVLVIGKTS